MFPTLGPAEEWRLGDSRQTGQRRIGGHVAPGRFAGHLPSPRVRLPPRVPCGGTRSEHEGAVPRLRSRHGEPHPRRALSRAPAAVPPAPADGGGRRARGLVLDPGVGHRTGPLLPPGDRGLSGAESRGRGRRPGDARGSCCPVRPPGPASATCRIGAGRSACCCAPLPWPRSWRLLSALRDRAEPVVAPELQRAVERAMASGDGHRERAAQVLCHWLRGAWGRSPRPRGTRTRWPSC